MQEIDSIAPRDWLESLTPRGKAELEFHNRRRDPQSGEFAEHAQDTYEKFYGNQKNSTTTKRSHDYFKGWVQSMYRVQSCWTMPAATRVHSAVVG